MRNKFLMALLLLQVAASSQAEVFVSFNHKNISYQGRIEPMTNECVKIYWPGTSAKIEFEGTDAKAILQNGSGNTYFYAIVDGDANRAQKIKPDTTKTNFVLASGLPKGKHSVELFKLTDNTTVTLFYGFELNDGARVLKPSRSGKRRIEFYGDSITAGHGVDVPEGEKDSGAPIYFNNYLEHLQK